MQRLEGRSIIFTLCVNTIPTHIIVKDYLQFLYLQITNIQAISFPQGNSEYPHEGIFDVLPVVDVNRIVQRSYDLDFHSGFDIYTVAALAAPGSYFVQCHNIDGSYWLIVCKFIQIIAVNQVHIGSFAMK